MSPLADDIQASPAFQTESSRGPLQEVVAILVRREGLYRLIPSVELLVRSIAVEVGEAVRVSADRGLPIFEGILVTVSSEY